MALSKGTSPQPFKLMFIGDSITVGSTGGTESTARGGYRSELLKSMSTLFKTVQDCGYNATGGLGPNRMCGTSGLRVDEIIAAQYVPVQLPAFRPDAVVLHIGTNDCTNLNGGTWPGGSINLSITDLGTLLDYIRSARGDTHVFIAKIVPNQTAGANDYINQWNSAMATAVAARSDAAYIHIVDQNGAFLANASWATDWMADTSHPNSAGNTVMANTWFTAIDLVF